MNNLDSIWKKFVYLVNEPSWTLILDLTIKQIKLKVVGSNCKISPPTLLMPPFPHKKESVISLVTLVPFSVILLFYTNFLLGRFHNKLFLLDTLWYPLTFSFY